MITPTSCGLPPGKFPACWTYELLFLLSGLHPALDIPRSSSFLLAAVSPFQKITILGKYISMEQSESLLHILFGKRMSLLILQS